VYMELEQEEIEELSQSLDELTEKIEETNSMKRTFLRGLVMGVGTFIGATILAALVITIILKILGFVGIRSTVEDYIHSVRSTQQ
jgi:tetrahydromethanopterin S-methyltransferase subunit G